MDFFKKLFDGNERDVARYRKIVDKINALEAPYQALSDDQLTPKTAEFRARLAEKLGDTEGLAPKVLREKTDTVLDEILPEAFAACREAARRTLGMRHYDVQLIGGMVQHDGRIAELKTGEGKTLMSTLATYLNALAGHGVHLVTANDYLVKRDAVWMGPLFHKLGLTIGILQGNSPETGDGGGQYIYDPDYDDADPRFRHARPCDRTEAYACDIVYGTSSEFGFDYLRDNMAPSLESMVQRGHYFAIVDECDSNLIDEARTPLIISGSAEKSSDLYYKMDKIIPMLEKGEAKKDKEDTTTDEKDYTVDEKAKSASFTERGLDKVERALGIDDISTLDHLEEMQYAVAALKAHAVFTKDRDYVVKENREGKPEVVIVDEFTGRLMFGRRWSDGLHQAIEAKEGITIENEQQTLATITIQNYFRLYAKLAGMTGTAKTEEDEFRKIYALDVVQVPTNKPMQRKDFADIIYKTEEAKLRGITAEILSLYAREQPVLVGTRSIEMSETVSRRLEFQQLEVLGAITILRDGLESKRKELGGDAEKFATLLNTPMGKLTIPTLAPVAKAVGVTLKMLEPATIEKLGVLLGIVDAKEKATLANSEALQRLLSALTNGIPHNVLNAKYHEQEARIIAEAGRRGAITIATNMAGRGVDILLGGTHYKSEEEAGAGHGVADTSYRRAGKRGVGHVVGKNDRAADPEELGPAGAGTIAVDDAPHDVAEEREQVRSAGGLFILGTERHESRRIDNQLRGRAGRQGDPGGSRFHVSLEDYLWRVFGDRNQNMLMKQWDESEAVDTPILSKMIERAQKKVEQHNFDSRKHVLEYDDVMNVQREVIYRERAKVLEGADLKETLLDYLHNRVDTDIMRFCPENLPDEEWDRDGLYTSLAQTFPLTEFLTEDEAASLPRRELLAKLHECVDAAYEAKETEFGADIMREIERAVTVRQIDQAWLHHLASMDYLKEGIGLRGYGQTDPLVAYKKEAQELFNDMQGGIQEEVVRNLFMATMQYNDNNLFEQMGAFDDAAYYDDENGLGNGNGYAPIPDFGQGMLLAAAAQSAQKQTTLPKVGPNDPCPCGSGKKYKKCHRNAA